MANSDYVTRNLGLGFCPVAILGASIGHGNTTAVMAAFNSPIPNGLPLNSAALIDNEIVVIQARTGDTLTIGRGCCDTVPASHSAGTLIWFFDASTGNDGVEYGATESIGVKVISKTGRAVVPIADSHPVGITFNWRFFRPYPPGLVLANGQPWFNVIALNNANLVLTWKHRDRVGQLDQLVDHSQDSIGPELGTTYEIVIYKADNTLVRTVTGIVGTSWTYDWGQMTTDFAVSTGVHSAYAILSSKRDSLSSYQTYRIDFNFKAGVFKDFSASYGVLSSVSKDVVGTYNIE